MATLSTFDITRLLERYPNGISRAELHAALETSLSNRTLQRLLDRLSKQGLVQVTGNGRSTRYLPKEAAAQSLENPPNVHLSLGAQQLLAIISESLDMRPEAGYQPTFLQNYQPNTYLSANERAHLLTVGQTVRQQEPAGTFARHLLERLLIDLSWNSSRLEGNTYKLPDTRRLLVMGQATEEKSAAETQMILNHKEAIEFLVTGAADVPIDRRTLLNLHALLCDNLLADPSAFGCLRRKAISIPGSTYLPPGMPNQIDEYFALFLAKAQAIQDPFEQAFFTLVQLPYLQSFEGVNQQLSRLAANIPFIRINLTPLSFVDVPHDLYIQGLIGVYERTDVSLLKDVFLYGYERSAVRYAEVAQNNDDAGAFRLRHRDAIRQVVSDIVTRALPYAEAKSQLIDHSQQLPPSDRETFINVVEAELLALHDGNFARFKVSPAQFTAWQAVWKGN